MEAIMQVLVDEIHADKAKFDERMAGPAQIDEIEALKKLCEQNLSYTPPQSYVDLLSLSDGIDTNGIQLYATRNRTRITLEGRTKYEMMGLVEANLLWRDYGPNNEYVFFAESGDNLYCHNLKNGRFEIVDRITKELIYEPSSFEMCERLLEKMLNNMLGRYEVEETENGE